MILTSVEPVADSVEHDPRHSVRRHPVDLPAVLARPAAAKHQKHFSGPAWGGEALR